MRIVLWGTAVIVLTASLFGQTPVPVSTTKEATIPPSAPGAASQLVPQKMQSGELEMAPNTVIATLQGVCSGTAVAKTSATRAKAKTCKTVITKAQIDAMSDILSPGSTPDARRQFALNYIRMLAAAGVAQEKHLLNDPTVAKEMDTRVQFTRTQVLAGSLYKRVEKLADDVKEADVEKYYADHASMYVQGEAQRLVFSKAATAGTPIDMVVLKTKAEEFQVRAAKGEDFDALQKEITQALNPGMTAPPTKMAGVRRNGLAPREAKVFDLKPGEVTPVLEGPGGFEIMKLVSIQPVPLDTVRNDIKTALTNGHLQLIMKDATKDVTADFNLAYLSLPSTPELFLSPSLRDPQPQQRPGMGAGMPARYPGQGGMPGAMSRRRPMVPGAKVPYPMIPQQP